MLDREGFDVVFDAEAFAISENLAFRCLRWLGAPLCAPIEPYPRPTCPEKHVSPPIVDLSGVDRGEFRTGNGGLLSTVIGAGARKPRSREEEVVRPTQRTHGYVRRAGYPGMRSKIEFIDGFGRPLCNSLRGELKVTVITRVLDRARRVSPA